VQNNRIIIGCDLHNTLLFSNKAWVSAFLTCSKQKINKKIIEEKMYQKCSRKKMAAEYNLDYNSVLEKYHEFVTPNAKLIKVLKSMQNSGFIVFLISSSTKEKVYKDLLKIDNCIKFDQVLTKENFCKAQSTDWTTMIDDNDADLMIYIGNDYDEDVINNERVVSLLVGHFFKELKDSNVISERGDL
jgi:hypothetical protein